MNFNKFPTIVKSFPSATIIFRSYSTKRPFRPLMMPKDNIAHLQELQKQRRRQKVLSVKYPPSQISIQVIGHGSRSDSRSVMLHTDHTNYLFNCGEGTQRLAAEHSAKLSKIEHIFVTNPTWDNIGGIPGVILTIQDTGVPKVHLHGPVGTIDLMDAIDNFVNINHLEVLAADTSQQFSDHTMTVEYHNIKNPIISEESSDSVPFVHDHINYYNDQTNPNGKRPRSPNNPNQTVKKSVPLEKNRINSMMVYACKVHPKAGSLNLEKCVDAGITPGPNLGKLKAGEDITLPDGTIVRSVDVVSPPEPGPMFIVMECPDEHWIDVIVNNPIFLKYQEKTAKNKEEIASYIIHFTPGNILNDPRYKEWMAKFGTNTEHLIINENNKGYASESIHKMQHQLHLINGEIFPFLEEKINFGDLDNVENERDAVENTAKDKTSDNCEQPVNENGLKIHYCKTLNGVQLRPHKGFENLEVKINPKEYVQDALNIDGFCDALADLQTEINNNIKSLGSREEYPKLLFLGTGSSIPNKVRNTSGILLQLSENNNIILDCGEGTVGQLVKFFGEEKADHILKYLNGVYVSHLHADHHLGFIGILKQRARVTDDTLFLLAPQQISAYFTFYHNRFESILKKFRIVSNKDLLMNQCILSDNVAEEMYKRLDVSNISTTFVKHCPFAYGVAITLKDGRKICYSGDTIPCDNLVKLATDSFLLIHEATMEDGLEGEAMLKHHSTISQAVNVGLKADVNFTLLTHFSQRYSKIPMLPPQSTDLSHVGIAYDFMQVKLSELSLLPLMYPSLTALFSEFKALLDEKACKRQWIKEQTMS